MQSKGKPVQEKQQPEYKKNLEKAESFVKHVQAGKEAAAKLGQGRQ